MTSNTDYLYDTITRRMCRGASNKGDVPLLTRLLKCQRRSWLMKGIAMGMLSTFAVQVAVAVLH